MGEVDRDNQALVDWLAGHDESCPSCAYSLAGLLEATCPECGAPLGLTIASPNASPGPWTFATISFALGLGFDAVVTIFLTGVMLFVAGMPPLIPQGLIYLGFVGLTIASCVGLILTLGHRSWWARQSLSRQWRVSRLIFMIVGAVHAVFALLLIARLA